MQEILVNAPICFPTPVYLNTKVGPKQCWFEQVSHADLVPTMDSMNYLNILEFNQSLHFLCDFLSRPIFHLKIVFMYIVKQVHISICINKTLCCNKTISMLNLLNYSSQPFLALVSEMGTINIQCRQMLKLQKDWFNNKSYCMKTIVQTNDPHIAQYNCICLPPI